MTTKLSSITMFVIQFDVLKKEKMVTRVAPSVSQKSGYNGTVHINGLSL